MIRDGSTAELPDHLRRYFWDHDPSQLSWDHSRHTIVRRLLESRGWDAVRWLRARMGDDELREFLERRLGRGMSPKRLRFWALVLSLPRELVDEWIAAQQSNPWTRRMQG